jgi:hypothetical protein
VHRDVIHQNWIVGKSGIEIGAAEADAVGHDVFVVAVDLNHDTGGGFVRVAKFLQLGDDAGNVLARTGGRGVDVDLIGDAERIDVMAVRVEKSGE